MKANWLYKFLALVICVLFLLCLLDFVQRRILGVPGVLKGPTTHQVDEGMRF